MKNMIAALLILSLPAMAGSVSGTPIVTERMTPDEMSATVGTGFWGGLACGIGLGAAVAGGAAIITAVGAGTTVGLGVTFAFSAGAHVSAVCALLD